MKSKSAEKIKLTSYDDLFGSSEAASGEKVVSVPIRLFHTFKDHPFRVLDDEKMQETVESVKRYGILMPGIMEHVTGRSSVFLLSFEKMRGSLLFLYKGRKKVYN